MGGTSVLPRTVVGAGLAVAEDVGATVADGLAVGVGLALAGAVQPPTMSAATISRTRVFKTSMFGHEASGRHHA